MYVDLKLILSTLKSTLAFDCTNIELFKLVFEPFKNQESVL